MTKYSVVPENDVKCSQYRICYIFQICLFLLLFGVVGVVLYKFISPAIPTPVIYTENGPVQGSVAYSRDGLEFWQFLGVPYAKPPTEKRKYLPPEPVDSWENVRKVTEYPPACVQFDAMLTARVKGQLDCLYLNVFVNVENGFNDSIRPVLIYFHGGGFLSGTSSMYHPDYFMDQDIVLVTFNYRLGPYGFVNLDTPEFPGNVGLLDQNLVLQWVQKNVAQFGGNPNKVTIFGESAGAVATHLHLLSPKSNKLFHKAVIQSGSALVPWAFSRNPKELAQHYAEKIECPEANFTKISRCYENLDFWHHLSFQHTLLDPVIPSDLFRPSADGNFLNDTPQSLIQSENIPNIPIMFGVNDAEGVIRSGRFAAMPELIERLDKNWTELMSNLMLLESPLSAQAAVEIRQEYFGDLVFTEDVHLFMQQLTELISDAGFFHGVHKSAIYHAKNGSPVYMYYFNYTSGIFPGAYSVFRAIRLDNWIPSEISLAWALAVDWIQEHVFGGGGTHIYGVGHGEDCYQLWSIHGISKWMSWPDKDFSRSFVKTIVDFANDTTPLRFRGIEWPTINKDLSLQSDNICPPYMLMDNNQLPQVISEPFSDRIKFWSNLKEWVY